MIAVDASLEQVRLKRVTPERADTALDIFRSLPIAIESHRSLMPRIWQLRHNLTTYDACYVALAEVMGVQLWTRDNKYAGAPVQQARIVVL